MKEDEENQAAAVVEYSQKANETCTKVTIEGVRRGDLAHAPVAVAVRPRDEVQPRVLVDVHQPNALARVLHQE